MKIPRKAKAKRTRSRSPPPFKQKGKRKVKRPKNTPTKARSKVARSSKSTGRNRGREKVSGRASKTKQSSSVVRIMGQGQYRLDSTTVGELNKIDNTIIKLVEESDSGASSDLESRFKEKLADMVSLIIRNGKQVDLREILPSDFILPPVDATVKEARSLFRGEGVIPE
jgi:hypothetical protein